jgi:cyclase
MTSTHQDHPRAHELPPPRTQEVAERVFAYIQPDGGWWINNTGFVLGRSTTLCKPSTTCGAAALSTSTARACS